MSKVGPPVPPPDAAAAARARERLDSLTKPPGSLGRLEDLAVRLAAMTGEVAPEVYPATVVVMAADHGVTAEGVSAYPAEVTPQMVLNFLNGGAAINVLARAAGAKVRVVDMGVAVDLHHPHLEVRKVRRGTANMTRGPAMGWGEALAALAAGIAVAEDEVRQGTRTLCLGEMGIGNTTAASALLAALCGYPPDQVVGRGTGLDDAGVARKVAAVARALETNRPDPSDPIGCLAAVGGLEIAGLAGVILGAARHRRPVLLDGFIAGAAALVAARIDPGTVHYMVAAHQSAEPGHRLILQELGLEPLLRLDLRLGEGTGAALALPLLDAATRVLREMATFAEAGVSGRLDGGPAAGSLQAASTPAVPPGAAAAAVSPAAEAAALPSAAPEAVAETPLPAAAGAGAALRLPAAFPARDREVVYRVMALRRDIRHFRPDPVPQEVLERILAAAHMAPSVGLSQPWNFILVQDPELKARLHRVVDRERRAAGLHYEGERAELYYKLKVEGILEAPVVLCVAVDPTRGGPHVLGRSADPNTSLYSASCAVQNLWLAARAEGIGAGWVSIYQKADVRAILDIPPHVDPIGLICLGYTDMFTDRPLLEIVGWERRRPLAEVLFRDRWGNREGL